MTDHLKEAKNWIELCEKSDEGAELGAVEAGLIGIGHALVAIAERPENRTVGTLENRARYWKDQYQQAMAELEETRESLEAKVFEVQAVLDARREINRDLVAENTRLRESLKTEED